ncbi:MAG: fasciclin domain-containing protein [Caldilineaceae bacterium]|nr:fasciclin domain-containing protein [Caldilineaceae bacterium]
MNRLLTSLILLIVLISLAACGGRNEPEPTATPLPPTATPEPQPTTAPEPTEVMTEPANILDIVAAAGDFTTLLNQIEQGDLTEKLSSDGPFTLFAPTDTAFAALPDRALADPNTAQDVLLYHVVAGKFMAGDLTDGTQLVTLLGDELPVTVQGDEIAVGGSPIVLSDLEAENGVVHVLETVLLPPSSAVAAGAVAAAAGAVDSAQAVAADAGAAVEDAAQSATDAVQNAATDAKDAAEGAADKAQEVAADAVSEIETTAQSAADTVQNAATDAKDAAEGAADKAQEIAADAVSEIEATAQSAADAVQGMGTDAGATAENAADQASDEFTFEGPSLTDAAAESGDFTTFLAAVNAAGMSDALSTQGPFTVFAPTQAAFDALPASVRNALLGEKSRALPALLSYHVVPGLYTLDDLAALDGQSLATAGDESLSVTVADDGTVYVDEVAVAADQTESGNGLIYAIDRVLIPVAQPTSR